MPWRIPKVRELLNLNEYVVHHEDVRRAQPGWEPRDLPDEQQKQLWAMVRTAGKALAMRVPSGVAIENSVTGSRVVLKAAPRQVVVHGLPSEVTMFLFGRQDHARVELLGPDDAVAALREASLGL